ncbi:hypothetical protein [Tsukamurella pulmonis]|uniref:hypothetical protein n=1 Tax=Tsukamurella pulmonis TaxID=47312 RepID=UPI001EDDB1EB|nr:hypothetical protein [Tsukamurella pulmonis]
MNPESGRTADATLSLILAAFTPFAWAATLPPRTPSTATPADFSHSQIALTIMACAAVWMAIRAAETTGRLIAWLVALANGAVLVAAMQFAAYISPYLDVDFNGHGYAEFGSIFALGAGIVHAASWMVKSRRTRTT